MKMKNRENISHTGNFESGPKYNVQKDSFDSEVFGMDVVKARISGDCDDYGIIKESIFKAGKKPMMVFGFTPIIQNNIDFFSEIGCKLTSVNNTYKYGSKKPNFSKELPSGLELFNLSNLPKIDQSSINKLTSVLAKTSRLFKDPLIPKEKAADFYKKWVENSLFGGYPDQVFILLKNSNLVGACTLKTKEGKGYIDLIGVSSEGRGAGLGSILLKNAVEYFKSKDINDVRVETQAENISANVFYQKSGFLINNVDLVYHGHF